MTTDPDLSIALGSPAETDAIAGRISRYLQAGDVLLLDGPIGAGKTHFARKVIQDRLEAVGRFEEVPSPTFTLVQTYDAGDVEIWHADLYRLTGLGDASELGLDDAFETAICLVEWPDRLGSETPRDAVNLTFTQGAHDNERILRVGGNIRRWRTLMAPQIDGAEA